MPERAWGFESPLPHLQALDTPRLSSEWELVFYPEDILKPILKPIERDGMRQRGVATQSYSYLNNACGWIPRSYKTQQRLELWTAPKV